MANQRYPQHGPHGRQWENQHEARADHHAGWNRHFGGEPENHAPYQQGWGHLSERAVSQQYPEYARDYRAGQGEFADHRARHQGNYEPGRYRGGGYDSAGSRRGFQDRYLQSNFDDPGYEDGRDRGDGYERIGSDGPRYNFREEQYRRAGPGGFAAGVYQGDRSGPGQGEYRWNQGMDDPHRSSGMWSDNGNQAAGGSYRGYGPRNYRRSDDRVCEDICDRLSDEHFLDASNVDVSVSEREVTLSGEVDSKQAKRRAEDCADSVSGVEHVQNNLRVKAQSGAQDKQNQTTAKL